MRPISPSSPSPSSVFTFVQRALLIAVLSMVSCVAVVAQIDRAVLEGTVTDSTEAAIVGASVKIVAVDTGISQEQRTNSKGYYRISGLAVGRYTVTVTDSEDVPSCRVMSSLRTWVAARVRFGWM